MYSTEQNNSLEFSLLAYSTDLICIIDAEAVFRFIGGAVQHMFGYQPEEMLGLCAFDFIHEDDLPKAKKALQEAQHTKVTEAPYFRFRAKSGEWRWLECTITNMIDNTGIQGFVTSSRDITERLKTSQMLQESEQRFRALFESHADAAVFQNRQGVIIDANPVMVSLLKMKKQEVVNRPLIDFLPQETVPVCQQTLRQSLLGSPIRYDIAIPFEEAGTVMVDVIKIPVKVKGEVIGVYSIFRDVTDVYNSRKIIEQQAGKLNSILESITDAFFTVDKEWRFSYVNSVFAELKGYERSELINKNIWYTFPGLASADFFRQCHEAVKSGSARHFEETFAYSGRTFSFSVYPSEEGVSVFFTDVTEIQRSREELEKLSLVASKTDNGVIITDAAGRTEWVNDGFTNITGYTLAEMAGKKPGKVLQGPETDKEAVKEVSRNLQQGVHFNTMLINYRKSGEKFWVSMDITPILDKGGTITQFIAILKDITYRKETEANLLKVTQDLHQQNKDLQQFSYMISHNLRAPAANVMGLADILSAVDKNSSMFDEALSRIKTSAQTLDTVIRDMNHVLSIRENNYILEKEEVNVSDVCGEALSAVSRELIGCQQTVNVDIDKSLTLVSNRGYLFEILKNLFSNAIKFRKRNETLALDVEALQKDEDVELVVKDNGIGMDMSMVGKDLFKLYKQFHKGYEGRGIGLFLVKTYVDALDGSVQVSSEPDNGTTFRIKLNMYAK